MLFNYEINIGWVERYLNDFFKWFYTLDVIFQYLIIGIVLYVLVLGTIEFAKKVLIYVPRKIIGIIVIILLFYIVFTFFQS